MVHLHSKHAVFVFLIYTLKFWLFVIISSVQHNQQTGNDTNKIIVWSGQHYAPFPKYRGAMVFVLPNETPLIIWYVWID